MVAQVVREEHNEVQRRRIGPVEILEDKQHRHNGRTLAKLRKYFLERPQLRTLRALLESPRLSERPQSLHERLIGQVGTDKIDAATEQHLDARRAGAGRELGHEPSLS